MVSTGQPHTEVKRGTPPKRPPLHVETYFPDEAAGRTVAIVEVYLDQTDKEALLREQFAIAGAALAATIALAFGLPGLAFFLRSRQKRRADERIAFLAHHDGLAGLLNRTTFGECLDAVLAEATRRGEQVAVHFLGLDRFKDINDTLGHDVGDELIRAVADRLRSSVRPGDLVARLGGDEFVVAQRGVTDESVARGTSPAASWTPWRGRSRPRTISFSSAGASASPPPRGTERTRTRS